MMKAERRSKRERGGSVSVETTAEAAWAGLRRRYLRTVFDRRPPVVVPLTSKACTHSFRIPPRQHAGIALVTRVASCTVHLVHSRGRTGRHSIGCYLGVSLRRVTWSTRRVPRPFSLKRTTPFGPSCLSSALLFLPAAGSVTCLAADCSCPG
ncbi:hypothetical protein VTK73DRAFT_2322 [Phialemonium thermophilum]|uniref:Uncharacterized protein n=1 Tax=Phialemonium thermophilum TaxID=223376 RepID=A0ABR3VSB3_9PEZI